jgi:hypothetical protein
MVLCNRCQPSEVMRPCVLRDGGPCLVCKEDMELAQKIQELQDRRRILRTQVNASHDPFHFKFPPEIASLIFSLSMTWLEHQPNCYTSRMLPTPFLLGSVNRRWRQLARSTPQLWSTLSFTLDKQTGIQSLPQIHDWLQLSGSLPLSFYIFNDRETKLAAQEIYDPVIDALNQHSGRWHKAVLHLPTYFFNRFFGASPPYNLWDLQLVNTSILNNSRVISPIFRMNSQPSPTCLTITRLPVLRIDIGWDNLTSLTIDTATTVECIEVIRRAPLLESCSLSNIEPARGDLSISTIIVRHIRLRELNVSSTDGEFLTSFMDAMEFPSLEEFAFISEYDWICLDTDSLISLINRSGSSLKRLTLDTADGQTLEGLKKLFDAVPCLQNLRWCSCSDNASDMHEMNDLLQQLSSSPILAGDIPGFFPHLRYLTLNSQSPGTFTWEYIPRIFNWSHRKFLHLELFTLDKIGIDDNDLAKILQLADQGVNICIFEDDNNYLEQIKKKKKRVGNNSI